MRPAAVALPGLIAAALLAACGGENNDGDDVSGSEPSSSQEPTQATSPSTSATDDAPDSAEDDPTQDPSAATEGTGPKTGKGSGKPVVLRDVRVAEHEDFDRIVLEFSGNGTPGWVVEYVDKAVLEGSGKVVRLDGDSTLNIQASNTTWPADGYYGGPKRLGGGDLPDVYVGGTFEGYTQVVAGTDDDKTSFRVHTLTQPSRLVIDINDEDDD